MYIYVSVSWMFALYMFFNAIFLFYIQWFYTIKSSSSHIICLYINYVWDAWLDMYLLLIFYIISDLLFTSIYLCIYLLHVVVVSPLFYLLHHTHKFIIIFFWISFLLFVASRRCRLVLKPYYCLYVSIPIYIQQQIEPHHLVPKKHKKVLNF